MKSLKPIFGVIVLILSFVVVFSAQKENSNNKEKCATVVTEKQKRVELEREANNFYKPFAPQLDRPFWIPLTIHIVRRNDGTGAFTVENLRIAIENLNHLWLQSGIQFYQYGNIDYINSDYHYTLPDIPSRWDELRRVNPVAHTINVYFVGELTNWCGQSSYTTSEVHGIIMDNDCAGEGEPETLAHEVGHYFDLYHTHETVFGVECPSGTNCSTAGDKICDTPADPTLTNRVNQFCVYTGGATAPTECGLLNYNPPTRNIMSYSRKGCLTEFTENQKSKILAILLLDNRRNSLYDLISHYVAPDGGLNTGCNYATPCRTLDRAFFVADPGDHIFLLGGATYNLAPLNRFEKRLFFRKWNTTPENVQIIP